MVSDETKRTIDALSKNELREEIEKGNRSRFQGDKFSYAKARLAELEEKERTGERAQDLTHREEELSLAREANEISKKANCFSKVAIWVSVIAALIALGTLLNDLL